MSARTKYFEFCAFIIIATVMPVMVMSRIGAQFGSITIGIMEIYAICNLMGCVLNCMRRKVKLALLRLAVLVMVLGELIIVVKITNGKLLDRYNSDPTLREQHFKRLELM